MAQELQEFSNGYINDSTSKKLGAVKQVLLDFSQAVSNALDEEMKKITRSQDHATQMVKLGQLEENIQKLVNYHEFRLQKKTIEQELEVLEKEVSTQQAKKQLYEQIVTKITKTQNDIVHTQQEFLNNQIETINPAMRQVSSTLSPHPYWSDLNINVGEKRFKGNISNMYEIISNPPNDTGDIVNKKGYFSRGQQNSVILALILGVIQTINKQLNFILLDDISQSLDTVATKNLVKYVRI